jgi:NADP-dependent 3-hydroxy acid dehydrogenase YdfG
MANKIAWITGAGSGIGEHTAINLSKEGYDVVLSGRTKENLEKVASKCDNNPLIKVLDVSDSDAVREVFSEIIIKYNKIDLLVLVPV